MIGFRAGDDLRHIQRHYSSYFDSMAILGEAGSSATFQIDIGGKLIRGELTESGYEVITKDLPSTGQVFESFEAFLSAVMGAGKFGQLLSKLVTDKLTSYRALN